MNDLHIRQTGTTGGRPLVLLHGWAMHSGIWQGWLPHLEGHELWLVDLPGHGCSRQASLPRQPAALADTLLPHLPAGAVWLGWSLGGLVALEAALQAPKRVAALVMLAASPCFVQRPDWPLGKDPALFRQFARQLEQDPERLLQQFLLLEVQGSPQARALARQMQAWLAGMPTPALPALHTGLQWLERVDLRHRLAELACPVLWLGGSRDRLVHPDCLRAAAAACPRGRVLICDGAVHAPFISHPDWTTTALEHVHDPIASA